MLAQLLRAVFVDDDEEAVEKLIGPYGPIGTNGARYNLAYCLGLITEEERDDLKLIADIRNRLAHQFQVRSFDHETPAKSLAKLHLGRQFDGIVDDLLNQTDNPVKHPALREIRASGRRKFQDTVRHLFGVLLIKLDTVQRPKRATWYPRASPAE
jgi:DNA-binding MltR family transcriptional regulator